MEATVNRVESEWLVWMSREKRFQKIFPGIISNNRLLQEEKLKFLEQLHIKFRNSVIPDEQLMIRILDQERKKLENLLYPNILKRMLRRFLAVMFNRNQVSRTLKEDDTHIRELANNLGEIGFPNLFTILKQKSQLGHDRFTIPVSYYVDEKQRMDYQIQIVRNERGKYQMDNFKAELHIEGKPELNRGHTFYEELGKWMPAQQARNLLEGRAVLEESMSDSGLTEPIWKQLDFTDRDNTGNFRVKEFRADYGFHLDAELDKLPIGNSAKLNLKRDLAMGNKAQVTIHNQEVTEIPLLITADPQKRTIHLATLNGKPTTIEQLTANKVKADLKTEKLQAKIPLGKVVRLGRSKGKSL